MHRLLIFWAALLIFFGAPAARAQTGTVLDYMLSSANKPSAACCATSNITLSGEQTIDGVTTSQSVVLCAGQQYPNASQNGPWISSSGAWTRPNWYQTGSSTQAQQYAIIVVRGGRKNAGLWCNQVNNVTVDSNGSVWTELPAPYSLQQAANARWAYWSVIGNNPNHLHAGRNTINVNTSRIEQISNTAIAQVRLVYANYWNGGTGAYGFNWGETPNTNAILVHAATELPQSSLNSQGLSYYPAFFNGAVRQWIPGNALAITEPIPMSVPAGGRFYVRTAVGGAAQMAAPSAPTLTGSTSGGSLAAGTYQVSITYVGPNGYETPGSTCSSVTTTGSSSSITVTAPSSASWAVGYNVYMGIAGGATTSNQYLQPGANPNLFSTNFVIKAAPALASPAIAGPQVSGGTTVGYPWGTGAMGGTGPGSANNGEGTINTADYVEAQNTIPSVTTQDAYGPIAVLGLTLNGVVPSVAEEGDSIFNDYQDGGMGVLRGGWLTRLLSGTTTLTYQTGNTPVTGFLIGAKASDQATYFATPYCSVLRMKAASLCTHVVCDYGTNDIYVGGLGSAQVATAVATIASGFVTQGNYYFHTTLLPRTTSSNGFQTVVGQTFVSNSGEGYRRAFNNWVQSTVGPRTITSENMFGVYATLGTSASNMYAGGNGVATQFIAGCPFKEGTETITVAGTPQTLTTNYTYLLPYPSPIDGYTYASGVTFTSAPANTVSVQASYSTMPSLNYWLSNNYLYLGIFDQASAVEANASSVAGVNGGFWAPPITTAGTFSSTVTSATTGSITDTSLSLAQDAARGYTALITADSGTPALVGQTITIGSNTPTVMTSPSVFFTAAPDAGASYSVIRSLTPDGIHPSSDGCIVIDNNAAIAAQAANITIH